MNIILSSTFLQVFLYFKNPRLLDPASKFLASVVKSCLLQNLFSFALGEYIYKVVCKAQ